MSMKRLIGAVVFLGAVAVLGGCGGSARMGKYNVTVSVDQAWRSTGRIDSIEVDVVGINPALAARWSGKAVSEYFAASGDQLRKDATNHIMRFSTEDSGAKTLSRTDDKWDEWLGDGATQLFVIADILGHDDQPGDADARRLILPLGTDRWKGRSIEIEIQRSGLVLKTPMKPVKQ